jgi:hypothetical protein
VALTKNTKVRSPPYRRLRIYSFDPSLSRHIETSDINEVIVKLPWEDNLKAGPVDDYLEVVDYDPATQAFYAPVDLNNELLLAQDGLSPSEGSPQFHQQMVYTVARITIGHFERALGRRVLWSRRLYQTPEGEIRDEPVKLLRIHPHGLREANAYYSPSKKALLFGYFPASTSDPGENLPGGIVFTCLSHDIVAHETTHALLDGLHPRFIEPTNVDVWALHEAFADIVALFQHFTYPEVLRHQIGRTRGELECQNLLGELAYQFGQAIGTYGALRSAIGRVDPKSKEWVPLKPDPEDIHRITEPHARGAILVAAVFEAFLTIYKWKIADLLRIATGGHGVLPPGELHLDLVGRLSEEAAKTSSHILNMCIRSSDYWPPVDVDFGDFLRALITADADIVTDDRHNYRLAVIEAFRRRGIYPLDVRNLSEESLLWKTPDRDEQKAFRKVFQSPKNLHKLVPDWGLTENREKIYRQAEISQSMVRKWFGQESARQAAKVAHIVLDKDTPEAFYRDKNGIPTLEVHSVRPARRIGPDGQTITDLVVELTQRRRGYYDVKVQSAVDSGEMKPPKPDFIYRGGCTLLVDLRTADVRHCIYKRILSKARLDRMRSFLLGNDEPSLYATYVGDPRKDYFKMITGQRRKSGEGLQIEPFRLLHRSLGNMEAT